jgi:hypothetical protein
MLGRLMMKIEIKGNQVTDLLNSLYKSYSLMAEVKIVTEDSYYRIKELKESKDKSIVSIICERVK